MKAFSTLILSVLVIYSFATTIKVPGTQSTIQAGLNAASTGDTVKVAPGTYAENITWPSVNGIILIASGDSSNTFIDGSSTNRVMSFSSGVVDSTSKIIGFTLMNGTSTSSPTGAGVYISNGAAPQFIGCMIRDNTGNGSRSYGAGVAVTSSGSKGYFKNCSISRNIGKPTGGNYNYGGGFYANTGTSIILNNSVVGENFLDSCARTYGAGIYVTGGAVDCIDSWIKGNKSDGKSWNYGCGIYLTTSATANLDRVKITDNQMVNGGSRYYGLGIWASSATLNATNTLIADNTAGTGGNWYNGGGINLYSSVTATLMNVTIANNRRTVNGAINGGGIYLSSSTATVTNSILWDPTGGSEVSGTGATITYSDVNGSFTGTGNINSNPSFAGATNYHIAVTSPCEGKGTLTGAPTVDIEKNARPYAPSPNPDMGAYEAGVPTNNTELEHTSDLLIYPNPSSGNFTIQSKGLKGITVYNLTGKVIFNLQVFNSSVFQLNLTDQPTGIYIVRIKSIDQDYSRKISVVR